MKKFIIIMLCIISVLSLGPTAYAKSNDNLQTTSYNVKNSSVNLSNTNRYSQAKCGTGKTVYVDQINGDDNDIGTETNPYKTIQKAKSNLSAGDTVVLDSGIYSEKIGGWQMNGTANNPITFTAKKGANVAVTSFDKVNTNWQQYSDKIYVTDIGKNANISHALTYKNGCFLNMLEARWPDADPDYVLDMPRAIAGEGTDNNYLYSKDLPNGNWNNATVYTWTGNTYDQYVAFARKIDEYKAGESLKFSLRVPDETSSENVYKPQKGVWYYLSNSLSALTTYREYYYDNESGMLYVITDDGSAPKDDEIWVEKRDYAVELWACNYVNFSNINFIGGGVKLGDTNYCTFNNANIYFADWFNDGDGYGTMSTNYNSTDTNGTGNGWYNCEIAYTMSTGINIRGNNTTVENCIIHDVNLTGGYNSGITINPTVSGTTIRNCSIFRSGRFLIYFTYDSNNNYGYANTTIEYNDLYEAMYLTQDGGLIYSYCRNGNGVVIRNNWVHDTDKSGARGIYLDNNSTNFKVYNNCVWNINEAGLVLNTQSENNLIYNNTILNCPVGIQVWPKNTDSSMVGTKIYNNIIMGSHDVIVGSLAPEMYNNDFTDSPEIDNMMVPLTDSNIGAYQYGDYYWTPGYVLNGDSNRDYELNLKDVILLKKHLCNFNDWLNTSAADYDKNGVINVRDVLFLQKQLVD